MRSLLTMLFWVACLTAVACTAPLSDKVDVNKGGVAPIDNELVVLQPTRTVQLNDVNGDRITWPAPALQHVEILPRDDDIHFPNPEFPTKTSPEKAGVHYDYSLQLLFYKNGNAYGWRMWQGPAGVSVNPCGDSRFTIPARSGGWETHRPLSLNNPPSPRAGFDWPVKIEPLHNCRYESDSKAMTGGLLVCGDRSLIYDFYVDPNWYGHGIIDCGDLQFHRGFYVDY
ncbi:hypothetical protein BKA63DRAFT_172745 [Paraphoma chrysanthemicola]|nr:hypothetical protein BKA63DRAFT_172745 [Paraphoma chrysanthemicola]